MAPRQRTSDVVAVVAGTSREVEGVGEAEEVDGEVSPERSCAHTPPVATPATAARATRTGFMMPKVGAVLLLFCVGRSRCLR